MTDNKRYSIIYERDGYLYSLPLFCSLEEAEFHADSLGLNQPEEVIQTIPYAPTWIN